MGWRDWFRPTVTDLRSEAEVAALVAPLKVSEKRLFYSSVVPSNMSHLDHFGSDSGEFVSERTALQHLAVYSCVRLLADSIASLPVDVFRKAKDGTRVPLDTPVSIMQPNPRQTGFEYMQQVVSSLALRGNSYEWVTSRDQLEYPLTRETVHPDDMRVTWNWDDGGADYQIRGQHVSRADVIHTRRLTLAGNIVGVSPIEQARQGIGLSLAAERYGAKWFGDSANPSSVLETDANVDDAEQLRIMRGWVASHGGRRHPAMLSGGLKYRPIAISPNESQFIETRAFQRGEIAMMFGIPPHMIGDTAKSTSWGCLPGDALVFTANGPVPIENVAVGTEVWSFGPNGMEIGKVTGWQMTGYKPLLTIHTRGRELRLTSNHRVPVRRYFSKADGRGKGTCGWETIEVSAGGIRVGDYLLVPHGMGDGDRATAPNGRELTVAAMELCGLYLGDGSQDKNRFEIAHEVDPDHMEHYSQSIRDEFGVEPYVDPRGTRTRFSSGAARDLLECGFVGTALTKRVPGWVFRLRPDLQLALLRGYLDADGSVQNGAIVYSSANKLLLEDMRHLCIQLGIPVGRIIVGRAGGPMTINGRTYQSQPKHHMSLTSLSFNGTIGSNSPRKAARFIGTPTVRRLRYDTGWCGGLGDTVRSRPGRATPGGEWAHDDVVLHKVNAIEHGSVDVPVYDIEVEGLAHFVSDGVIVHNTGIEQQTMGFVRFSLMPWLRCIEDTYSWLMLPRGQYMRFNLNALLRGDTTTRYAAYTQARNAGWMSVNEIRAKEDLEPIPDGDNFIQPLNMGPLGADPTQGAAPPAPAADTSNDA